MVKKVKFGVILSLIILLTLISIQTPHVLVLSKKNFSTNQAAEIWNATISFDSEYGGSDLTFGVHPDATTGFDEEFDEPAPPAPPAPYVIAYFNYPENPEYYKKLMTSIIPPSTTMEWPIRVEFYPTSTPASVEITVTWNLTNIPEDYYVYLVNATSGEVVVDLKTEDSYTFTITVNPPFPMWYQDFTLLVSSDITPPTISDLTPEDGSWVNISPVTISASFSDDASGVNPDSVIIKVDGTDVTSDATITASGFTLTKTLSEGMHTVEVNVSDYAGNEAYTSWSFGVDLTEPQITDHYPVNESTIYDTTPWIYCNFTDALSGIDASSVVMIVNGTDVTGSATITDEYVKYKPTIPLDYGKIEVEVHVSDVAGNTKVFKWWFNIHYQVTFELKAGWNLISIPVQLESYKVSDVFGSLGTFFIYGWNAESKAYYSLSANDELEIGKGYWILVTEDVEISISGLPVESYTLTAYPGWNLIGSVVGDGYVTEITPNILTPYIYTWKADAKAYQSIDYIPTGYGAWILAIGTGQFMVGPPT